MEETETVEVPVPSRSFLKKALIVGGVAAGMLIAGTIAALKSSSEESAEDSTKTEVPNIV